MDVRSSRGPPRPLPTEDVAVQLRMERDAAWERGNRLARVLAEIEASGGQLAPFRPSCSCAPTGAARTLYRRPRLGSSACGSRREAGGASDSGGVPWTRS